MRKQGVSELIISGFKVKDNTIKLNCATDEWKKATIYLLFENYTENAVIVAQEGGDDDGVLSVRQKILNIYEVTGSENDIIPVDVVVDTLRENKKKITNELTSIGVTKRKCNKEIYRNKHCFYGLKLKPAEEASPENYVEDEEYYDYE
jgi:hypothetical protein